MFFRDIIDSIKEIFPLEKNEFTRISAFKAEKKNLAKLSVTKATTDDMKCDKMDIKNFD